MLFRLLVRLGVSALIALSLLIGAARWLGSQGDYPAAALIHPFDCSPHPCWAGLRVGVTSIPDALTLFDRDESLRDLEYHPATNMLCWKWQAPWHNTTGLIWDGCYNPQPDFGNSLFLDYQDDGLRLGDLLAVVEKPDTSILCLDLRFGMIDTGTMRIVVRVPDNAMRITPNLTVTGILFFSSKAEMASRPINYGWSGFSTWGNLWNFCSAD